MASDPSPSAHPAATRRTDLVVALSGGVLMALEILALRILSPSFGSSVYVWGAVLSVFLAAMSTGYVIGGRLADQHPHLDRLGTLLLASALGIALLIGTAFDVTEWLARHLAPRADAGAWGPLVAAAVLFGPTTVLLASASPFAVRLAARDVSAVGRTAGRLYAVSTAGSLAGTLLATFALIPFFELDTILLLLGAGAIAAACVAQGRSVTSRPTSLLLLTVVLATTGIGWAGSRAGPGGSLVERRLSPYQTLEVVDRDGERTLLSNGYRQASLELTTTEPALRYARAAKVVLLHHAAPRRALFVGLGGGSVARILRHWAPELDADHVEIDPAVLELAERHFGFASGPRDRVHLGDGRRFLRGTDDRWDLIVIDTYVGLSIPFHLATREMFELAASRLDADGLLLLNLAAPPSQPLVSAILATVRSVFPEVTVYRVPGASGTLVVAGRSTWNAADDPERVVADRARHLEAQHSLDPTFAELLEHRIDAAPANDAVLLRDAFAPVDRLLHLDRP